MKTLLGPVMEWFKPTITLRFVLDSGAFVEVRCKKYEIKHTGEGKITSYNLDGMKQNRRLLCLDMTKIAAVVRVR